MSSTPLTDGQNMQCVIVATQEIWIQSSADYNAVKHIRTKVFQKDTPIKDVIAWASSGQALQRGNVILTESENNE